MYLALGAMALFLQPTMANVSVNPVAGSDGQTLEGSWIVEVSISLPGLPSSFTALETYSRGGGIVTSNDLPVAAVPKPGQGEWEKNGKAYSVVIQFFTFDTTGVASGTIYVSHTITLDGKDSYSGIGQAKFYDLSGNLLLTGGFTTLGKRLSP